MCAPGTWIVFCLWNDNLLLYPSFESLSTCLELANPWGEQPTRQQLGRHPLQQMLFPHRAKRTKESVQLELRLGVPGFDIVQCNRPEARGVPASVISQLHENEPYSDVRRVHR